MAASAVAFAFAVTDAMRMDVQQEVGRCMHEEWKARKILLAARAKVAEARADVSSTEVPAYGRMEKWAGPGVVNDIHNSHFESRRQAVCDAVKELKEAEDAYAVACTAETVNVRAYEALYAEKKAKDEVVRCEEKVTNARSVVSALEAERAAMNRRLSLWAQLSDAKRSLHDAEKMLSPALEGARRANEAAGVACTAACKFNAAHAAESGGTTGERFVVELGHGRRATGGLLVEEGDPDDEEEKEEPVACVDDNTAGEGRRSSIFYDQAGKVSDLYTLPKAVDIVERIATGWCPPYKAIEKVYTGVASGTDAISAMRLCSDEFKAMEGTTRMTVLYESDNAVNVNAVRSQLDHFLTQHECNHECAPSDGRGEWVQGETTKFFVFAALRPRA